MIKTKLPRRPFWKDRLDTICKGNRRTVPLAYYASWASKPRQDGWTLTVSIENKPFVFRTLCRAQVKSCPDGEREVAEIMLGHFTGDKIKAKKLAKQLVDWPGHGMCRLSAGDLKEFLSEFDMGWKAFPPRQITGIIYGYYGYIGRKKRERHCHNGNHRSGPAAMRCAERAARLANKEGAK